MKSDRIIAVIMAGGGGTRFWPRSRRSMPKQFLSFDGEGSLLRQTVERLDGLVPREQVLVVTGIEHIHLAREHAGVPDENVIGEPCGRNTAPCVGLGSLIARSMREDAVVVALAADHLIQPTAAFHASVARAAALAADSGALVTMGLRPDRPATGYGYIETGDRLDDEVPNAHRVVRFCEKPDLETARGFVEGGKHLWNSGNLAFTPAAMLTAIAAHLPDLSAQLMSLSDPRSVDELARVYPKIDGISVDYGVLEKADHVCVVEAAFDWDDLGTFESVARHATPHGDSNLARGDAVFIDSRGSLIENDGDGIVVVSGLDDVLVVRTSDAILVMPREGAEGLKKIVKSVEDAGFGERL
ncbi:MAG: NTP transferase domain-containing protein [Planctomycetes bacterium]|nr:NTP transferase domain-containing protein [Planctomycetota bacterium]